MTYWTRSAVAFQMGKEPPPDLYAVCKDWRGTRHVITYAEHMAAKRGWQKERLERIRHTSHWHAWLLSVGWSPGLGKERVFEGYHVWLRRAGKPKEWLRDFGHVRRLLPLGLLPTESNADWMLAFVRAYPRGRRFRHAWGARIVWRKRYDIALKPPSCPTPNPEHPTPNTEPSS